MFGGNYAPAGWALCNGQLMAISQNEALFSLIGTTYGGDGVNTFGLPDLQGRVPVHQGGNALLGQKAGSESITLVASQVPVHNHTAFGTTTGASTGAPAGALYAATDSAHQLYALASAGTPATMAAQTLNPGGAPVPHDNLMPFVVITFIISLNGIYPSQN
jgi:microcystin-dependent protein